MTKRFRDMQKPKVCIMPYVEVLPVGIASQFTPQGLAKIAASKRQQEQELASKFGIDACAAWTRLFGSGWTQQHTQERSEMIALLENPHSLDQIGDVWKNLAKMPRKQAYRILGTLPMPLLDHAPEDLSDDEAGAEHDFWMAIASWLLSWDAGVTAATPMLTSLWSRYEQRARISELRFQMIRKMVQDKVLPPELFPQAGLPWLLSEVAACRQRLNNIDVHTSKRTAYNSRRGHIKALDLDQRTTHKKASERVGDIRKPKHFDDFVYHFDQVAEVLAREYAAKDSTFDRQYLKPYLSACTSWNRSMERDKAMQPIRENVRPSKPRL
jgi:hypothetical protein